MGVIVISLLGVSVVEIMSLGVLVIGIENVSCLVSVSVMVVGY